MTAGYADGDKDDFLILRFDFFSKRPSCVLYLKSSVDFQLPCVTNSTEIISALFASGKKLWIQEYAVFHKTEPQHRNLFVNSFFILLDLGRFSSGWFSSAI